MSLVSARSWATSSVSPSTGSSPSGMLPVSAVSAASLQLDDAPATDLLAHHEVQSRHERVGGLQAEHGQVEHPVFVLA